MVLKDSDRLHEFLLKNENEILAMTEKRSYALAGVRPSSEQLKKGSPIFYKQLLNVLLLNRGHAKSSGMDEEGMARAAVESNEPAMAIYIQHQRMCKAHPKPPRFNFLQICKMKAEFNGSF